MTPDLLTPEQQATLIAEVLWARVQEEIPTLDTLRRIIRGMVKDGLIRWTAYRVNGLEDEALVRVTEQDRRNADEELRSGQTASLDAFATDPGPPEMEYFEKRDPHHTLTLEWACYGYGYGEVTAAFCSCGQWEPEWTDEARAVDLARVFDRHVAQVDPTKVLR